MAVDLTKVDSTNAALQVDPKAATSVKRAHQAVVDALHQAFPPTPVVTSGLGVYAMGGSLSSFSHLTDATYSTVIGDWSDAALLATCKGTSYAYTVTTEGVTPGTESQFVILDANPAGGTIPNSLPPSDYATKCINYVKAHPGLDGVFLDNCVNYINGLPAALLTVSQMFKAAGVKFAANVGYRGALQDDGSGWIQWATTVSPYLDRVMLENWMTDPSTQPPTRVRVRGTAWYQNYDGWSQCVKAVPGKFMGVNYGSQDFGVYGRAAMLVAVGADPGNVFYNAPGGTGPDQYGQPWQKTPANPVIDPVNGTASL